MSSSLCRNCGQPIKWIKTKNGKNMPLDPIGIDEGDILYDREKHSSHWDTCVKQDPSQKSAPQQGGTTHVHASASVLNASLTTRLEVFVAAVKTGNGHGSLGQDFIDAVVTEFKPPEDDYDDDIPF